VSENDNNNVMVLKIYMRMLMTIIMIGIRRMEVIITIMREVTMVTIRRIINLIKMEYYESMRGDQLSYSIALKTKNTLHQ